MTNATATTVNTPTPNFIGTNEALAIANGTGGTLGNGSYLEMSFPMSGESSIGVSYATYASSASGYNNNQWSYSEDGVNFTPFGSAVTQSPPPGSNHIPAGSYGLVSEITSGLDGFTGTAYLRYTLNGASGTATTPTNRIDNVTIQSDASSPPASNPATLPSPGDIVMGLNNADSANTLEIVRGSVAPQAGVRYPLPVYNYTGGSVVTPTPVGFIEYVKFDNYNNVAHNANGNLIAVDFGTTTAGTGGAKIYSLATTGSPSSPVAQLIGANSTTSPLGSSAGAVTQSRLASPSASPNNTKIALAGYDSGKVVVYDYVAGNTQGAGASLSGGRETTGTTLNTFSSQGTAWKDNSNVLAFSAHGNLVSVDASSMAVTDIGVAAQDVVTPELGSNVTSLVYNPAISPYLYALYSGFGAAATPSSQTRIYVFDPANNYALLTTQTSAGLKGIDLSGSSQTGRDLALDKDGNLFISAFDSTITYLPAADFATPASIAATANNSSIFYYGSTYAASNFAGLDIGFAGLAGDYNGDGKVDAADYVAWRKGNSPTPNSVADYNTWRANYGATSGPGAGAGLGTSTVPEPASAGLFLLGLAAMCWRRRGA